MGPSRLLDVILQQDRIENASKYPFQVPVIASFERLKLTKQVTFFVGENGSGKSTLLEAIALAVGFGAEGGTRNFTPNTTDTVNAVKPLADALRLIWSRKLSGGFFLRAESFFNVATAVDELGPPYYGDRSLHAQSHGESFMTLLAERFRGPGLYLLDEPEAAVSPQRQLTLLAVLHDLITRHPDAQLIIATHSPILLALPEADIISFDGDSLERIRWEDVPAVSVYRSFLERPEWWLTRILDQTDDD